MWLEISHSICFRREPPPIGSVRFIFCESRAPRRSTPAPMKPRSTISNRPCHMLMRANRASVPNCSIASRWPNAASADGPTQTNTGPRPSTSFANSTTRNGFGRVAFRITSNFVWQTRYTQASEIAVRALAYLGRSISDERARLLATLGLSKAIEGEHREAEEAFQTALALADRFSDKSLRGAVLAFRVQANFLLLRLREVVEDYRECEELIPKSDAWNRVLVLCWTQGALYQLGRSQEAAELRIELDPLAKRIGHAGALAWSRRIAAWTEFGKKPDLERLIENLSQDFKSERAAGLKESRTRLSIAEFYRGNWDRGLEDEEVGIRPRALPSHAPFGIGAAFRQKAYAGDREGAPRFFRTSPADSPVLAGVIPTGHG